MEAASKAASRLASLPNKNQRKMHAKACGWRQFTFVWFLYDLYGFDPAKDIIIDAMHCFANVIRDLLHAQVHITSLELLLHARSAVFDVCTHSKHCLHTHKLVHLTQSLSSTAFFVHPALIGTGNT